MARILVVSEHDPELKIEIVDREDGEEGVDGACSDCAYTISDGGTWFSGFEDMVRAAEIHIDRHHTGGRDADA